MANMEKSQIHQAETPSTQEEWEGPTNGRAHACRRRLAAVELDEASASKGEIPPGSGHQPNFPPHLLQPHAALQHPIAMRCLSAPMKFGAWPFQQT